MSLPTSVTSARVRAGGRRSIAGHNPDSMIPGRRRARNWLSAPYERPCPSAATTSTRGPHAARDVATTVLNPRVRLLAPSAITRSTEPVAFLDTPPGAGDNRGPNRSFSLSPAIYHAHALDQHARGRRLESARNAA